MKTDLREYKWRTPDDARRARRWMIALLAGWFVVDLIVFLYWPGFWQVVENLGIWRGVIVVGFLAIFSAGGWMQGWQVRDRRGPDG